MAFDLASHLRMPQRELAHMAPPEPPVDVSVVPELDLPQYWDHATRSICSLVRDEP